MSVTARKDAILHKHCTTMPIKGKKLPEEKVIEDKKTPKKKCFIGRRRKTGNHDSKESEYFMRYINSK